MCYRKVSGRQHFACFTCRKVFRPLDRFGRTEMRCPACGCPMVAMGICFKTPRQQKSREWRKIALLVEHGYRFPWRGCCPGNGPGFRPKTLAEIPAFLQDEAKEEVSANQHHKSRIAWELRIASSRKKRRRGRSL